jgi:drug/metabolite transporter (DMT)-like permease
MGALLALVAALAYGTSDFAAGVASRRLAAGPVAAATQACGLLAAGAGVLLFPGAGLTPAAAGWGAASGIGSAVGTLCLYQGLSAGPMSVVATVSSVLTAVIPAVTGVTLGDRLSVPTGAGIVIAVLAIGLISWQPGTGDGRHVRAGLGYGALAGMGFALLLIALDRAGTHAGAWPLIPGQAVSLVLVAPFARGIRAMEAARKYAVLTIGAGLLSGIANLVYLAATGQGQLAIVAVLTALYPAVTVLLARACLAEGWTRLQAIGLLTAAAAVILLRVG